MLWTLILSFTIGGWVNTGYREDGTIPSLEEAITLIQNKMREK